MICQCPNDFSSIQFIARLQTDGVVPKIRQRCLLVIVLPIWNRTKPIYPSGPSKQGRPHRRRVNSSRSKMYSISIRKARQFNPVKWKNYSSSYLSYSLFHGDSIGWTIADRLRMLRSLILLWNCNNNTISRTCRRRRCFWMSLSSIKSNSTMVKIYGCLFGRSVAQSESPLGGKRKRE